MKPLDKKQLPQVIVLGILTVALLGYFAVKMIMPTPAAAGVRVAPPVAETKAPVKATDATPAADAGVLTAPPPTPGMHDPFVPQVSDQLTPPAAPKPAPAVRTASLKGGDVAPLQIPSVAPLPSVGIREIGSLPGHGTAGLPGVPSAPVAPDWTVTGVLQSGSDHVAILRNGNARRFVKQGDSVDGQFRVDAVTRSAVILRHGHNKFTLILGAAPVPAKPLQASDTASGTPSVSGQSAPDFALETMSGKTVSLSSYRGHVVVLDFWATWCGWCQKGMPQVQTLYSRYASKGLAVLSVNSWDQKTAVLDFLRANPQYTTTMLYDPAQGAASVATRLYGVKGIPYTVVVDKNGRIAATFDGYSDDGEQRLEAVLSRLGLRPASPDIARLPVVHLSRRMSRPLMARLPRVTHHYTVCPVVKVADYRIEEFPSRLPNTGTGLLTFGAEAPDFSLCALDGRSFSLSQFRGNAVILDFWSSWYAPSLRSLAPMDQLQQEYAGKGVTVVAVNTWDSRDAMQAALGGRTWNCSMLFDPSISNDSVAVRSYRAPDVPTFYVIDQDGRIAGAFVGFSRSTTSNIKATLAKLGIA